MDTQPWKETTGGPEKLGPIATLVVITIISRRIPHEGPLQRSLDRGSVRIGSNSSLSGELLEFLRIYKIAIKDPLV